MNTCTINPIELACRLAEERLDALVEKGIYKYEDLYIESESEIKHTEEGQDLFNEYYDHYTTIIEETEI
jgi:hypothetical protein